MYVCVCVYIYIYIYITYYVYIATKATEPCCPYVVYLNRLSALRSETRIRISPGSDLGFPSGIIRYILLLIIVVIIMIMIVIRIPFGDHPLKLERCREY